MTGAVIQARMGSSRLPGKVLEDISGQPLLWHVIKRLERCEKIDKVVVATSTNELDDPIETFCQELDINCFRGSESNVLNRFVEAAKDNQLSKVVRICADSPLIDPETIDTMIHLLEESKSNLVTISPDKTSLLDGFEVTRLAFLEKLETLATEEYHFEHVTYLAKEKPELGKVTYYDPPRELCFRDIRITVDTEKDLEFIREVYKWLYEEDKIIDIRKIEKLPFHIFRINQEVRQKPALQKNWKLHVEVDKVDDTLKELAETLQANSGISLSFSTETPEKYDQEKTSLYFELKPKK